MKKAISMLLAAAMAGSLLLAGCGDTTTSDANSSTSAVDTVTTSEDSGDTDTAEEPAETEGAPVEISWLIDSWSETYLFEEYEEGPIQQYWMNMPWKAAGSNEIRRLDVDFTAPPAGNESDYINTLLATDDYPEVMSTARSSMSSMELYENGISIDLTDYVEAYMPNYLAWIDEHQYMEYVTNMVDGERKFIQIYGVSDESSDMWGGYSYRRDWIIKYGRNPETGAAFSGEWVDGEWVDDVVFPSGGDTPIYISDWEWMLEIFAEAVEDLGIDDGYPMSIFYPGYLATGDMASGFGSSPAYYIDANGDVQYGMTSDGMRSYIECMTEWYANGWIDKSFEERSSDIFFYIDQTAVYSGKVGLWYGLNSALLDGLDSKSGEEDDLLNGIVVYAAPQPINDKYGDKSTQNQDPFMYFCNSICGTSVILTNKVQEEDIPTLLTAIDYLYTVEGGLLRSYGFSNEQMEELQDPQYLSWGLTDGAYIITEVDGETHYVLNTAQTSQYEGSSSGAQMIRVVGMEVNHNVDSGQSKTYDEQVRLWTMYPETGSIPGTVTGQMDTDASNECSTINSSVSTYCAQEVPNFITGRSDIYDDAQWEEFCDNVDAFGTEVYIGYINEILGK